MTSENPELVQIPLLPPTRPALYEYRVVYQQFTQDRATVAIKDEAKARRWKKEIDADKRSRSVTLQRRRVIPWEVIE
jgi:hypothetical protein